MFNGAALPCFTSISAEVLGSHTNDSSRGSASEGRIAGDLCIAGRIRSSRLPPHVLGFGPLSERRGSPGVRYAASQGSVQFSRDIDFVSRSVGRKQSDLVFPSRSTENGPRLPKSFCAVDGSSRCERVRSLIDPDVRYTHLPSAARGGRTAKTSVRSRPLDRR